MKPRAAWSEPDRGHRVKQGREIVARALSCVEDGEDFVYFVQSGDRIKIGSATGVHGLGCRYNNARTWVPHLRFALLVHGGAELEAILHRRFARLWVDGEWFRFEGELADYVQRFTASERCETHEVTPGATAAPWTTATLPLHDCEVVRAARQLRSALVATGRSEDEAQAMLLAALDDRRIRDA